MIKYQYIFRQLGYVSSWQKYKLNCYLFHLTVSTVAPVLLRRWRPWSWRIKRKWRWKSLVGVALDRAAVSTDVSTKRCVFLDFIFIFFNSTMCSITPDLLRLVKFGKTSCDGKDVSSAQDLLALLSSPLSVFPLHPCLPSSLHLPLSVLSLFYVLVRGHQYVVFISSLHSVLGIPLEMLLSFPSWSSLLDCLILLNVLLNLLR